MYEWKVTCLLPFLPSVVYSWATRGFLRVDTRLETNEYACLLCCGSERLLSAHKTTITEGRWLVERLNQRRKPCS